jgi:hypothetical protein
MKASGWLGLSGDVKVSNESTFECTTDIGEVGSSHSWSFVDTIEIESMYELD